jgi:hypothetical protein
MPLALPSRQERRMRRVPSARAAARERPRLPAAGPDRASSGFEPAFAVLIVQKHFARRGGPPPPPPSY